MGNDLYEHGLGLSWFVLLSAAPLLNLTSHSDILDTQDISTAWLQLQLPVNQPGFCKAWTDEFSIPGPCLLALPLTLTVVVPSMGPGLGSRRRQDLVSTQVMPGALSTAHFFLYEAFLGQHFEAVELEENEPELGDLFLFRLTSPVGQWLGAHIGVYCGHGEIIHFEGRPPPGPQAFMGPWEGLVSKQGWRQLLRSRSLWRVLRSKGGVDPKALKRRVQEAMNADSLPYHPTHSNCVHFTLTLLGQGTAL